MGLIRRLREWREKVDGTLTGPAIETDSATVNGTTTTDTLEADKTITDAAGVSYTGPVSLLEITVDDFVDGDISEYSGDTGDFTTLDDPPRLNSTTNNKLISSNTGLEPYPQQGTQWGIGVKLGNSDSGTRIYYGFQDMDNNYRLLFTLTRIRIEKEDGGTTTDLASKDVNLSIGNYYYITFRWVDSTIVIDIINQGEKIASISATDSTYTSGGIAFGTTPSTGPPDIDWIGGLK